MTSRPVPGPASRAGRASATGRRRGRGASVRLEAVRPLATSVGARARRADVWTVRAVVLGLVVVALALTLAWPATLLLRQQGELEQLDARERDLHASIERLEQRRAALQRPEVVEAEARARLGVARPEEEVFVVVDVGPQDDATDPRGPGEVPRLTDSVLQRSDPDDAWWDRLLQPAPVGATSGRPGPAPAP